PRHRQWTRADPPVRAHRDVRVRRRRLACQPGRPAVHEGGGQPGAPVRSELGRPAARRLLARRQARPETRLPPVVQLRFDRQPGHRAGPHGAPAGAGSGEVPGLHRGLGAWGDGVKGGRPVRIGVVGTGALGYHAARLLRAVPDAALVGIFDINPARAAEVARELETVAFPSLGALVEAVDAVSVAVPTPAHTSVGLEILGRGRHALIEKPLADSLEGAEALVAKAAEAGVLLQVGHVERFNRAVRAAAPYLDEPRFFQTERLAPFQPRGTDVAVILDLMIHDLDLVLELVRSDVTEVRATGVPVLSPHVDIANARVEFANGAVALVTASRISRDRTRKLRIFQQTRYFSLDLAQGGGHYYRLKSGWQGLGASKMEDIVEHVKLEAPEAEPLRLELESFVGAVRGEGEVVVSGAAGVRALALAWRVGDATRASLRAGRYNLVILIDYPGYHLRLAAAARAAGVPVLYYIAPQLWAWGAGRVKRLAASVKHLAVILPFEEQFFRERGVATTFVGHPLKDRPALLRRDEARCRLGLDPAR